MAKQPIPYTLESVSSTQYKQKEKEIPIKNMYASCQASSRYLLQNNFKK